MHNRIKYQGRVYMLESEFDEKIKERLEEKIDTAIDEVLDSEEKSSNEEPVLDDNVALDENVATDPNEDKINQAVSAVESSLGISIDETGKLLLQSTLSDILENSVGAPDPMTPSVAPTDPVTEAPEMVLHEGRIYRKVGPLSTYMAESTAKKGPAKIRVGGQVFKLAESRA